MSGADSPDDASLLPLPSEVTSLLDNGCLYLMSADDIMGVVNDHLNGAVQAYEAVVDTSSGKITITDLLIFVGPEIIPEHLQMGQ